MEKFSNGSTTRWSWKWYGVGYMKTVYRNNCPNPGITFFLNSYRTAPWHFNLLCNFGWWKEQPTYVPSLYFSGSYAEPYNGWRFHVGRAFVGGETPKWMLRLHKRYQEWCWLREAKRTNEGLCPKCGNGVTLWFRGYPGETIAMCNNKKCQHVEDTHMDYSAIE